MAYILRTGVVAIGVLSTPITASIMPASSLQEMPASTAMDAVPAPAVRQQLARIVNSPGFASSPRLCRFLTHSVNRTIEGDLGSLKEFSVAMEVFDRNSDYDPNIDAIVRVEARRLRAKLKAYYEQGAGRHDPVLIELRVGSYVPIFRWLDTQQSKQREQVDARIVPGIVSAAVLPFVNMSPDPEQDYFCDGISEEIINCLTHVPGLKVVARTSAFQFKGMSIDIREVGRHLEADLVIEGSVRKAGAQLRITCQAIQTESGHHLWSEVYGRELNDAFAIQDEVAESIARWVRVHMAEGRSPTLSSLRNLDAYTTCLKRAS